MATKTVVCPECGSSAAPGRYACAECGALLAAVAVTPRGWDPGAVATAPSGAAAGDTPAAEPAEAEAAVAAVTAVTAVASAEPAPPEPRSDPKALSEAAPDGAFDEDAPLGSPSPADASATPDVLHAVTDAPGDDLDVAAAAGSAAVHDTPPLTAATGAGPASVPASAPPAPSWPPPGDRGPVARPEPRTPAGSYLPPSAVLPPLDLPSAGGSLAAATAAPGPDARATAATLASRASAAVADALSSVRVSGDASRRAVATGAGIAALGTLLPWVNTLPGASPIANYLDRWGLAGGGVWLVLLGLIALAVIAGSSGRAASWPVRLPAVATAAFLVGLVWPYLLGGFGRAIGVWVLLVGAIVLAVGGLLETRGRHAPGEPDV